MLLRVRRQTLRMYCETACLDRFGLLSFARGQGLQIAPKYGRF